MHSCFLNGTLVRQQFHLNKGYTSPTVLRPAEIRAVHVSTAKFVHIIRSTCICVVLLGVVLLGVLGKYMNSLCMWWLLISSFIIKMLGFVCVKYSDHARFIASRTSYVLFSIIRHILPRVIAYASHLDSTCNNMCIIFKPAIHCHNLSSYFLPSSLVLFNIRA